MIYVDNFNAPYGRMIMCHLMADTKEELLRIVDKIGVNRKWIQKENTKYEHFDICLQKKKLALKYGAKEISWKEMGKYVNNPSELIDKFFHLEESETTGEQNILHVEPFDMPNNFSQTT